MSSSKTLHLPQLSPTKSVPNLRDFGIKLPKPNKYKRNDVMYFKDNRRVNMNDWQSAKMARENNFREVSQVEIEEPKFGAGSVFGKEAKEDARKRKLGIIAKKYDSASQPWMMKVNSKIAGQTKKKYKGVKKGGIGENASYYILIQASDKTVDAISLNDWYEFQQIQTYKSLTAEEAEEEYNRRDRRMNLFELMVQKRLRNNDDEEEIEETVVKSKKKKNKQGSDFKISELDEWVDSDDESDDSNSDDNEDKKNDKESESKKKKNDVKKKKKKRDVAMEAFEESDDGDEEGRELDYISDSSASENELELQKEIKAVDEIESTSSDEELENNDNSDKSDKDDDDDENGGDKNEDLDGKSKEKKEKKKDKNDQKIESAASSSKRSRNDSLSEYVDPKKFKPEITTSLPSPFTSTSQSSGLTLEAVRRYLMRKPMTTTDLLQKFKSKKTGLSSKEMALQLTKIMQTLKPSTQKVKDKVYFFLGGFHRQNITIVKK